MAPLPANSTDRLFFDYVTGDEATSQQHTCAVRYDISEATTNEVQNAFLELLEALTPAYFRTGWRVVQVRSQLGGTDVSLPIATNSGLAAWEGENTAAYTPTVEATELMFVGRSFQSGRRCRLSLYTCGVGVGDNFRVNAGESGFGAVVTDAVAVLQAGVTGYIFRAIDGTQPNWYPYVNLQYNSYWEGEIRNA